MRLLLACLALSAAAAEDPTVLLQAIRQKAVAQVSRSANYACVETIERSYLRSNTPVSASCRAMDLVLDRREIMHDRLRLDLAVSDNAEIYSWHGENKFSSNAVSDIVQGGPISSGSFVGYLRNIFLAKDVQFTYSGSHTRGGVSFDQFHYMVPKDASNYAVKGATRTAIVPFHGDFKADTASSELLELTVTADDVPFGLGICTADSTVRYQLADMSGFKTLIPASFDLRILDDTHMYTVSQAQYSQCHEFRAESSLSFVVSETSSALSAAQHAEQLLPPGLFLKLALQTPINDETSYTGDAVQAILSSPVHLADGTILPSGSTAHGIITELENITTEDPYHFLRIAFDRVAANGRNYVTRTVHKPGSSDRDGASRFYRGTAPAVITSEIAQGSFLIPGKHFRLNRRLHGEWETLPVPPSAVTPAPGS